MMAKLEQEIQMRKEKITEVKEYAKDRQVSSWKNFNLWIFIFIHSLMLSLLTPFLHYQRKLDVDYQEIVRMLSEMLNVVRNNEQEKVEKKVTGRSVKLANIAVRNLIIYSEVMVIPYVLYYV